MPILEKQEFKDPPGLGKRKIREKEEHKEKKDKQDGK